MPDRVHIELLERFFHYCNHFLPIVIAVELREAALAVHAMAG
jgi:hypothetical protein